MIHVIVLRLFVFKRLFGKFIACTWTSNKNFNFREHKLWNFVFSWKFV